MTSFIPLTDSLTYLEYWENLKNPQSFIGMKGICDKPCVPMRSEASDAAEMVTQLCFGDLLTVLDAHDGCLKVRRDFNYPDAADWDSMTGWIDDHLFPAMVITESEHARLLTADNFGFVGSHTITIIRDDGVPVKLPIGCRLPDYISDRTFRLAGRRYHIQSNDNVIYDGVQPLSTKAILKAIEPFIGVQYLWGGNTGWGADCSGFVQAVMRVFGVKLPHIARLQMEYGDAVDIVDAPELSLAYFGPIHSNKNTHIGFLYRPSRDDYILIHAKQNVKAQKMLKTDDGLETLIYPESAGKARLTGVRLISGLS